MTTSTALLTDHYELTMVQAALRAGTANRRSVFEVFARRLPEGRRYGVVGGVGRVRSTPSSASVSTTRCSRVLSEHDVVDETTLEWLANYRFSGDIWGYPEGEIYFPYSPLMIVESTFAEAVLLETLHPVGPQPRLGDRLRGVADDVGRERPRPCIEMGSRRTHEEAAVAAARAAYVAGFATTSNLAARQRYGVPTAGTSAHAFTLLHDTERDAFTAQVNSLGTGTTLLVDTYDITEAVFGSRWRSPGPSSARCASTPATSACSPSRSAAQLDGLGATHTRIVVTSDLDEYAIAALAAAPVDGYGVGTSLVTGSGHPTCGFVYKLVARAETDDPDGELVSVAKKSTGKISIGGRKYALRRRNARGVAEAEVVGIGEPPENDGDDRPLLVPLVRAGEVVGREDLDTIRARHLASRDELPMRARQLSRGEPVIPTEHVD